MCEAVAFVVKNGDREKLMENVITVQPDGDKLLLTDLFGEQKIITAQVEKVDLTGHEIILRVR